MATSVATSSGNFIAGWRVHDIEMTGLSRLPGVGAPYLLDDEIGGEMMAPVCSDTRNARCVEFAGLLGAGSCQVNPRRRSTGSGGPSWPPSLVGVASAALLMLAACSSSGASESTTTISAPVSTTADLTTSSTSTSIPVTTTTTALPPDDDVIEAWDAYWNAWAEVRAAEDLDGSALESVASSTVIDGALALFDRERISGLGAVETEVVLHPTVTELEADSVTVEDCVLLVPSFTDNVGVWHEADLIRSEEGWIVSSIRIRRGGACVPRDLGEAAIAGYQAYYAAEAEFWDPADPNSPLLDEVLADPQKSFIVALLEQHEEQGVALRGQPTTHPEVIEVRSPTELVILSCLEPDPDYGLYDVDSDERLLDEPPVRDGQRDLQSAVMVFEDGAWKVSDLQGQVDFACEFAPTDRGLPSV